MPGGLPLRGAVGSPRTVSGSEGFGRDKAALVATPRGGGHGQLFPNAQVGVSLLLSAEAVLLCTLYLYRALFHLVFWLASMLLGLYINKEAF